MGPYSAAMPAPPFVPERPPPMAPYSAAPAPVAASPSFVPEYPPVPGIQGPVSAKGPPSLPGLPGWAPPTPSTALLAPRARSNKALWVGVALVCLLVASGITLGALYYLGWLDADPPAKAQPHRTTTKPAPRPAPTPHPGGVLR